MNTIFGGSKQKQTSESGNTAYPWLQQNYGATGASAFNGGLGGAMGILGIGGDPASSQAALDNFWKSSGGDFLLHQGIEGVNNNMYARGLGLSGADMKGLEDYRSGLASTKLQDILNDYLGVSKLGLGAGDLIANAGQFSKGQSSGNSSQGIASTIGALLAFA